MCSNEQTIEQLYFASLQYSSQKYDEIYWASKETYHFFRATLTEIHAIKINNIWTQISFNTS